MKIDEAYASLNLIQDFIAPGSSNRPGQKLVPRFITVHNTDNASSNANAAAHAKYQKGADARARKVSWHFTVDDKAAFQSVPTNEVAWHAASSQGNGSSIGVEICMHPEMNVSDAYNKAALLIALLAKRSNIPLPAGIVQHHHWSGKHCPRVLRDKPGGWESFVQSVVIAHNGLEEIEAIDLQAGHDHDHGDAADPVESPDEWRGDHKVIARKGLRLRSGPGTDFSTITILPFGTSVKVLSRMADWVQVQIDPGEGADGFVHSAFVDPLG
ncbi:MAG: N-acetylmuramoyl-L-alanine amidase [Aquabacterium sp.]|uniref:N-acetylmuramoyl-L-alanine amidase n=1 Tax=Aquabacterium sp. TaxID=1872578 RepID=UPI00271A254F|nr:N-acetylmuramoyl-L-alanine amidase [Aquabacterium sp.]MDO9006090.1 N-acetylmuramoyl-L-alanine amidase [Aquabacterium sp.]